MLERLRISVIILERKNTASHASNIANVSAVTVDLATRRILVELHSYYLTGINFVESLLMLSFAYLFVYILWFALQNLPAFPLILEEKRKEVFFKFYCCIQEM